MRNPEPLGIGTIGTEVLVDFIDGDMDRPVVVACLYNGEDLPPWSAGVDSNANHPGTKEGYWFTPAKAGSRRHFKQGETMPDLGTAWGSTIWQWDDQQTP